MTPRTSQNKPVNPKMVILGREARALSQKMLADALGVQQSLVSMMEMGLRRIQDDMLEALAEVLNYPPHFFLQEGEANGVGLTEMFHRKRQDVPKRIMDKIDAQINIRIQHIAALITSADTPPLKFKRLDISESTKLPGEIAQIVRASLELPRGPIEDLTRTLEDAGVLVTSFDFETSLVDAQSRWVPGLPPLIFINQNFPKDRIRFSLAHELGHLVMHASVNLDMEEQAHRFASEFLLPQRDILPYLRDLDLIKLTDLKRYWKVSMAAILKRAEDLKVITPNRARYLWSQMAKAGYKTREPVELDVHGEQPRIMYELAEFHVKDLGYSEEELQAIIPLNLDELREQYLLDPELPKSHLKLMRA